MDGIARASCVRGSELFGALTEEGKERRGRIIVPELSLRYHTRYTHGTEVREARYKRVLIQQRNVRYATERRDQW